MRLETGISPCYVSNWTVEMALREVIQNYLDVLRHNGCTGRIEWFDGRARISDDGPGLELRHLALGEGDKDEFDIGQFGEGLKLALLVLVREGRMPVVLSSGRQITPVVEVGAFDCETLAFDVVPAHTSKGTVVECMCGYEELKQAREYFAYFRSDIEPLVPYKLSLPGGRIFVNGALVGHIDGALFSYHLHGAVAQGVMNRDREIIDEQQLKRIAGDIVSNLGDVKTLTLLIQEISSTRSSWEAKNLKPYPVESVRGVWKDCWEALLGPNAIVSYPWCGAKELQWASYMEYIPVRVPYDWVHAIISIGILSVDAALRKSLDMEPVAIPRSELTAEELVVLDRAIEIVERHYYCPPLEVRVAEDLIAGADMKVDGLSRPEAIYLMRQVLQSLKKTAHTLLHETVHAVTGYGDRSEDFEEVLLRIGVKAILTLEGETSDNG